MPKLKLSTSDLNNLSLLLTFSLLAFFSHILISDEFGHACRKPNTFMFKKAIDLTGVNPQSMIYVGNDLVKDKASEQLGIVFIDHIHFPKHYRELI